MLTPEPPSGPWAPRRIQAPLFHLLDKLPLNYPITFLLFDWMRAIRRMMILQSLGHDHSRQFLQLLRNDLTLASLSYILLSSTQSQIYCQRSDAIRISQSIASLTEHALYLALRTFFDSTWVWEGSKADIQFLCTKSLIHGKDPSNAASIALVSPKTNI